MTNTVSMKFAYYLLTFISLCISCTAKELPIIAEINTNSALIKISHEATQSQLEQIQSNLRSTSHIDLDFSQSTFLDNGRIQNFKFSVRLPNGSSGTASADLLMLQYHYCGFSYNPDGSPSFMTGIFWCNNYFLTRIMQ